MKKFHTMIVPALGLALAATTACAVTGCSSADPPAAQERVGYDGETLLRGVFLGTGPAAERIPELWQNRPSLRDISQETLAQHLEAAAAQFRARGAEAKAAELDALGVRVAKGEISGADLERMQGELSAEAAASGNRIIAAIGAADPTYFARFAEEMQSGDHLRVRFIMADAGRRFLDVVSAAGGAPAGDGSALHPSAVQRGSGPGACVFSAIAVAVNVAVVAEVVAVVVAVVFLGVNHQTASADPLRTDDLVNTITTRFAR